MKTVQTSTGSLTSKLSKQEQQQLKEMKAAQTSVDDLMTMVSPIDSPTERKAAVVEPMIPLKQAVQAFYEVVPADVAPEGGELPPAYTPTEKAREVCKSSLGIR